ncbi:hypothetical protein [Bacillus salipaludis]|uniref:Uncharacterized protein n=1 Tax=Bacillus salipaludis TaxID=2547811 RepID=A0AA90QVK4_9BACI|nr:hypothetical protein [Bacillus salipaludis]MDQ6595538.1 hypothetical protein [Bacillus salipaludis]
MSIYFEYLLVLSNNMLINAEIWFRDFFSFVEKCQEDRELFYKGYLKSTLLNGGKKIPFNKPLKAKTYSKGSENGLHEADESQNA